jgi:hypothetical protein
MARLSELDMQRQRAAKNESLIREVNEQIEDLASNSAFSMFICECMNELCDERVPMTLEEYEDVRRGGNRFVVLPGHNVAEVEEVIDVIDGRYVVVAKLGAGAKVAEELDPRSRDA